MKVCLNCEKEFPSFHKDENGKRFDCRKRKYCLECNPVGERNFWGGERVVKEARKATVERECKICHRKYHNVSRNLVCTACTNKKVRTERKADAIEQLGGSCNICGYDKCVDALEFHHKDQSTKEFSLSGNWGLRLELVQAEVQKCALLCCRCHRELHAGVAKLADAADLKSADH